MSSGTGPGAAPGRSVVALVFHHALNGLLADEGTAYYDFCFELLDEAGGPDEDDATLDLLRGAHAHLMGRRAYEGMSAGLGGASTHPWAEILTAAPKVVFSTTLTHVDWADTRVATADLATEVDALRRDGDGGGHIVAWGGVGLWRSLIALDLLDEFHVGLHPYVADEGTALFGDVVPPGYRLDLVSARPRRTGVVELHYRRHRS